MTRQAATASRLKPSCMRNLNICGRSWPQRRAFQTLRKPKLNPALTQILVAVFSVTIGVPGLVFALYGANNLEELKAWSAVVWPFAASITAALAVAALIMRKRRNKLWILAGACAGMIAVVFVALYLAPIPPPPVGC